MKEFARLRATADLGGQQTSTIGALVKGFRGVVPGRVCSSWSPRRITRSVSWRRSVR